MLAVSYVGSDRIEILPPVANITLDASLTLNAPYTESIPLIFCLNIDGQLQQESSD